MTEPHHKPRWYVMLMVASTIIGLAFTVADYFKPQPKPQLPKEVELEGPLGINAKIKIVKETPPPVDAEKPDGEKYPTGYERNEKGTQEFLKSLDKPTIREAGPELFKGAEADVTHVLLYKPLYRWYRKVYGKDFVVGKQMIGDCVSWGFMHAIAIAQATNCELGLSSEFLLPATEAIYGGSRVEARGGSGDGRHPVGGWGDGSYGGAAAKFVHDFGILWRKKYDFADLTVYSGDRAKQWGAYGCGGQNDQGKAEKEAKLFPAGSVALVRNSAEAKAATKSGYAIAVCSGQGFSSRRDENGVAAAQGSWAHCMCIIGWRTRDGRDYFLILNSWGPDWITGGKWPDDMPDGSFWAESHVVDSMLRGNDSFAVSGVRGFPFRDLSNGDWVRVDVRAEPSAETQFVLAP